MQGKYPLDHENGFKLLPSHSFYWMEKEIEQRLGYVTEEHSKEHDEMMRFYNIEYKNTAPLNGRLQDNGMYNNRRAYHFELHLKYWKGINKNMDLVEKYEQEIGSLDNVPHPEVKNNGK